MKVSDLKPGDIIAISKPKGFLPKAIRLFMWLWSVIRYGKIPREKLYNHTMLVYERGKISEAINRGYVRRMFFEHYFTKLDHMAVFRLKQPLTTDEVKRLQDEASAMADKNIDYEIFNFLWWAVYIITNGRVDWSPKGKKQSRKVFCFEVSAMLLNTARPGLFANPSKVNTVDIMNDPRFEMLHFE